ncbi:hypothetical protein [Streptomyces scopuliridis]|uniref:hypothetical protein n=1 Tax=Streptomyces scopuliridis TaxID=452529 RepID=UPI00369A4F5A
MTSAKSSAAGRPPRAKAVLIAVVGLHLVAETALTPFLPKLFDRLYAIDDPGATGLYLWVCRIVGLAALPLWGLAARRWPLHSLVLAGLCGSAVLDLLLGMAPSYTAYTVISTAVVATNSALLLAYPAFIAEHRDEPGEGERARLAGTVLALRGMRGAPATRTAQPTRSTTSTTSTRPPEPTAPRTPTAPAPDPLPTRTYSEEIPR